MRHAHRLPAVASVLLLLTFSACNRGPAVVLHGVQNGAVRVHVEIVNTPEGRAQGLMYRKTLGADDGMLFIFPREEPLRFWMKNTLIPLDMIFIDQGRHIVGIVADATPQTTVGRGVDTPSIYVLEVNGGFAAAHGIRVGSEVDFERVSLWAR